jgi:TPR repeat protein
MSTQTHSRLPPKLSNTPTFADAASELRLGRRAEAVQAFRLLAEAGHVEAQCVLAKLYWFGRGVIRDIELAEHWFSRAAANGHADSLFGLASLKLADGKAADAFLLTRQAATQGHMVAMYRVAQMYEQGIGSVRDEAAAIRYYEAAAKEGHVFARERLGLFTIFGRRRGQSAVEGYVLLLTSWWRYLTLRIKDRTDFRITQ